jgi:hypothetical protein
MSWVRARVEKMDPKEGLATIHNRRDRQSKCTPKGKIKKMWEEKDKRRVDKP